MLSGRVLERHITSGLFWWGDLWELCLSRALSRHWCSQWEAAEFESADGVRMYLDRLRASPLMKKPLPQASLAVTRYFGYRRFLGQTMGEYLIGEEKMFSDYKRALERLKEQAISAGRLKRRWSAAE